MKHDGAKGKRIPTTNTPDHERILYDDETCNTRTLEAHGLFLILIVWKSQTHYTQGPLVDVRRMDHVRHVGSVGTHRVFWFVKYTWKGEVPLFLVQRTGVRNNGGTITK